MKFTTLGSLAVGAVLLLPAAAFGVLRAEDFERERLNAMHHAQIQILKYAVPAVTPGNCRVWGEVVQLFKGASRYFGEGTKIEFDISCKRRNDLIPSGDTQWLEIAQLKKSRFIETYLNSRRDGAAFAFKIPAWQYMVIDAPSSQPLCPNTLTGVSCTSFVMPDLDVQEIAENLGAGSTEIRVTISKDILQRLRVVAAQISRQRNYEQTTVSDVVAEVLEERIDALEAEVR